MILRFEIFGLTRNHGKKFLKLCQTSFSGIVHSRGRLIRADVYNTEVHKIVRISKTNQDNPSQKNTSEAKHDQLPLRVKNIIYFLFLISENDFISYVPVKNVSYLENSLDSVYKSLA